MQRYLERILKLPCVKAQSLRGTFADALQLKRLSTNVPDRFRSSASDESTSVIHAPQGYQTFISREEMDPVQPVPRPDRQTPTPFQKPGSNHTSPRSVPPSPALVAEKSPRISRIDRTQSDSVLTFRQTTEPGPRSPPIIFTSVSPTRFGLDNMTPRAHTREDVEALAETKPLSRSNSLEGNYSFNNSPHLTHQK